MSSAWKCRVKHFNAASIKMWGKPWQLTLMKTPAISSFICAGKPQLWQQISRTNQTVSTLIRCDSFVCVCVVISVSCDCSYMAAVSCITYYQKDSLIHTEGFSLKGLAAYTRCLEDSVSHNALGGFPSKSIALKCEKAMVMPNEREVKPNTRYIKWNHARGWTDINTTNRSERWTWRKDTERNPQNTPTTLYLNNILYSQIKC